MIDKELAAGTDPKNVFVCGFSQGGSLSLSLFIYIYIVHIRNTGSNENRKYFEKPENQLFIYLLNRRRIV